MRAKCAPKASSIALVLLFSGCATTPPPPEISREERIGRVFQLADRRSLGQGELASFMREPDPMVRAQAALAAGRIGDASAAGSLTELLSDPSAYVRSTAAFGLGLLEGELPEATAARLSEALEDSDARVRGRAAEALARQAGEAAAEQIADAFVDRLPDGTETHDWTEDLSASALNFEHFDLRQGLLSLGRLRSLRWAWSLLATPGETPRFSWWPAAWAASHIGATEMQPLFLFYAGSPDPAYRVWGVRGLGSLGAERAQGHVRLLLHDPNEKVRIEAIRAIKALRIAELGPDLLDRLSADTVYVKIEVLEALGELRVPSSLDPLTDLLGSPSPWIRASVLPALARQDADTFWLLLSGLGDDPDWMVRGSLAELMGRLSGERPVARVRATLNDPDARVRAMALSAFAHHGDVASASLLEHLSADDPFERAAAASGLGRLAEVPAGAADRVLAAFESEQEPLAAATLLDALAKLSPSTIERTARGALGHERYIVRRKAADILVRIGAERRRPPVGAFDTDLAPNEYVRLVETPFTPQAFLRTSQGPIELELFVADAPLTVHNFVRLARDGFYNGLPVTHVKPNGFVRTGDPRGDGNGGPGHTIRSEINERPFLRGTLAMHDVGKDTAGSQFFITHWPMPELDGRFTVFGQVTRGMTVVDALEPGDTIEEITIWDGVTSPYRSAARSEQSRRVLP
jgi:cyclophilin family peptidyl-prolyl cis-trans isomerase/HEAT repeat protein